MIFIRQVCKLRTLCISIHLCITDFKRDGQWLTTVSLDLIFTLFSVIFKYRVFSISFISSFYSVTTVIYINMYARCKIYNKVSSQEHVTFKLLFACYNQNSILCVSSPYGAYMYIHFLYFLGLKWGYIKKWGNYFFYIFFSG